MEIKAIKHSGFTVQNNINNTAICGRIVWPTFSMHS